MDNQIVIYLFVETKKTYSLKTQATTYIYSKYKKKEYQKANRANI